MADWFGRTARPLILAASRSSGLRESAERMPLARQVVRRFVPGESQDDLLAAGTALLDSGRFITVDYLGEDTVDAEQATRTVGAYLELLDALAERVDAAHSGVRPLEISLKLSALGQALPADGEKIALENAQLLCAKADQAGVWVTVDAEDHTTTDSTLGIVRALRADFPWLGTVLQAYLRRTYADCAELSGEGSRVRLCKGAYDEPESVAFRQPEDVDVAYLRCLRVLMEGEGYPMVASHDPSILEAAEVMARETGRGPGDFEYQMLYGIRDPEQRRLSAEGHHMRVYVPYGQQWYGYFVRRLAERPANMTFFLRALMSRR